MKDDLSYRSAKDIMKSLRKFMGLLEGSPYNNSLKIILSLFQCCQLFKEAVGDDYLREKVKIFYLLHKGLPGFIENFKHSLKVYADIAEIVENEYFFGDYL